MITVTTIIAFNAGLLLGGIIMCVVMLIIVKRALDKHR